MTILALWLLWWLGGLALAVWVWTGRMDMGAGDMALMAALAMFIGPLLVPVGKMTVWFDARSDRILIRRRRP